MSTIEALYNGDGEVQEIAAALLIATTYQTDQIPSWGSRYLWQPLGARCVELARPDGEGVWVDVDAQTPEIVSRKDVTHWKLWHPWDWPWRCEANEDYIARWEQHFADFEIVQEVNQFLGPTASSGFDDVETSSFRVLTDWPWRFGVLTSVVWHNMRFLRRGDETSVDYSLPYTGHQIAKQDGKLRRRRRIEHEMIHLCLLQVLMENGHLDSEDVEKILCDFVPGGR